MIGSRILDVARPHLGERYVLGSHAPLANRNWTGPWDCAEFASWLVYQAYGMLYGCGTRTDLRKADPYSGSWWDDAETAGVAVPVDRAVFTPGAFLVRRPRVDGTRRLSGHVALSVGDGTVYEAAGAKLGVRVGPALGRRWDVGVELPDVVYERRATAPVRPVALPFVMRREEDPRYDDHVVELQAALRRHGFDPGRIDGRFGDVTEAAVAAFQASEGLIQDGEVGPDTGRGLGLPYWDLMPSPSLPPTARTEPEPRDGTGFTVRTDPFGAVVSTSHVYSEIKDEYAALFSCCVVADRHDEIAELARRIAANRARYQTFVQALGERSGASVPWHFVALVHAMECSGDVGRFRAHLHNGDPLTGPTLHDPPGRPRPVGGPFTWEESAADALAVEHLLHERDWSLPRMLFRLEAYNGMGARSMGHATPYLWSYSNHYRKGKFVRDHVYDPAAVSGQPGAASILRRLTAMGVVEPTMVGARS